jgi:replicative DNA helicase
MFFSAETGQMALETRFLARMSRIDSRAIRGERVLNKKVVPLSKKEHAALKAAADELKKLPIYMNYTVSDQDQMLALIEQVVLTEGIHYGKPMLIIYDYLQYGSLQAIEKGLSEYLQVSLASIRFKQLNKVLNHAVMALSQVKRDAEGDDSPKISWFKNSGRVEIDADTALILTGERVPGRIAKRKLTGVKQREGEVGFNVDLLMQQDICLFEGLPSIGTEAPQETGLFEDVESGF